MSKNTKCNQDEAHRDVLDCVSDLIDELERLYKSEADSQKQAEGFGSK